MQENLRVARFQHRLVLAVCTLLWGLGATLGASYNSALLQAISWLGPLFLCGLMVFCIAHLNHLKAVLPQLLSRGESDNTDPWMPLSPCRLTRLLGRFSLCWFPLVTAIFLFFRLGLDNVTLSAANKSLIFICIIAIGIFGLLCSENLKWLSRQLGTEK